MSKSSLVLPRNLALASFVVFLLSTCSLAAAPDRIMGTLNNGASVALRGYVHRQAQPQYDQGPADPGLRFGSIMLGTVPSASQQKALNQLLADQQNPTSPKYHHWLTPEQWADQFGLSLNDVQKITAWLKGQGFTGIQVARGRNWFLFSGTVTQVESAFGTQIHRFNVNGEMHVANASSPKIPAALQGIVTGVTGLDDFFLKPRTKLRTRPYYTSSNLGDLMAPGDVATMYDINPLYNAATPIDGSGQKVAIIGQTDIYLADINDFRTGFGLSSISCTTNSNKVITACNDAHFQYMVAAGLSDPGAPDTQGDLSEADLDIEMAGAVARGAKVIYVNAPATFDSQGGIITGGTWVAWMWAVNQNVAPVISLSYGNCEFGFNYSVAGSADETELQKANSEGITFVNSSGDSGAAECDGSTTSVAGNLAQGGIAVSWPASAPEVTGAGGTGIDYNNLDNPAYWGTTNATDGGSALSYIPEQAWNDDAEIGSFCVANPTNTFCTNNHITNAKSAQSVIGISSGGGGASNCATQTADLLSCVSGFPKPAWQTVTISGQSTRMSPDISLIASANFPGYIFCTPLSELGGSGSASACAPGGATGITNALALNTPPIIGGTSAAAPLFAGMVALLNQYLASPGQGNINPKLYQLAANVSANKAFHGVNTGNNQVYCSPGMPSAMPSMMQCPMGGILGFDASAKDTTTNYNLVTGLGSVDLNNMASAWNASTYTFSLASNLSGGTLSLRQGNSGTINLTVQSTNGFLTGIAPNQQTVLPVTYTCSGLPSETTCTFAPLSPTQAANPSVAIQTMPPSQAKLVLPGDRGSLILYAVLMPGLFGVVLVAGSRKRSLRRMKMLGLIVVLGASTMWLGSCGGSNNSSSSRNPGTPLGSYKVTVHATTSGGPSSSLVFTLAVTH